jgi:hypothetical protein
MVRLEAQLSGDDWNHVAATDHPIIRSFNRAECAGLAPEHAADIWPQQMLSLH